MRYRVFAIAFSLLVFLVLAGLNWTALTAPALVYLLLGYVEAPLGIVLLVILGCPLLMSLLGEIGGLVESRESGKELQQARKLAFSKEDSRIHELQESVSDQLREMNQKLDEILDPSSKQQARQISESEKPQGHRDSSLLLFHCYSSASHIGPW